MQLADIDPASRVRRSGPVVFTRVDQEMLAIDARLGECFSLSETAGRVWELIREPISLAEICQQLRREYAVDATICEQDVRELILALTEAGLVEFVDAV